MTMHEVVLYERKWKAMTMHEVELWRCYMKGNDNSWSEIKKALHEKRKGNDNAWSEMIMH